MELMEWSTQIRGGSGVLQSARAKLFQISEVTTSTALKMAYAFTNLLPKMILAIKHY